MIPKSYKFKLNLCLLIIGIVLTGSGFLLQFNYHMGHHGYIITSDKVLGLHYYCWSMFHKISSVIFSIIVLMHLYVNYNWIKGVVTKHLTNKHKQVFIFSILFIISAVTGFAAWCFSTIEADELSRKTYIEIHDKITLILFVFLILHVWKRRKRIDLTKELDK